MRPRIVMIKKHLMRRGRISRSPSKSLDRDAAPFYTQSRKQLKCSDMPDSVPHRNELGPEILSALEDC